MSCNASMVTVFPHESKPVVFIEFPVLSHYKAQKPCWHFNRNIQCDTYLIRMHCPLEKIRQQLHWHLAHDLSEPADLV